MSPIRMHNASASTTTTLRYPNNAPLNQLPQTKADAIQLTGKSYPLCFRQNLPNCNLGAGATVASGLLGLGPLPADATVLERQHQFLDHIGVFMQVC